MNKLIWVTITMSLLIVDHSMNLTFNVVVTWTQAAHSTVVCSCGSLVVLSVCQLWQKLDLICIESV